MENDSNILLKSGKFIYKVLTPEYRDQTLVVLARAFCTEPVCFALGEKDPSKFVSFLDWIEFVEYWMDHCSSNGMSVIAIDEESHRIAGAFIVRDLLMIPEGFDTKYNDDKYPLTPWMNFLWYMDAEATKILPDLGTKGSAVDLWFLGVHPDYRGNKIANDLIKCIIPLVKKAGFKYATIEATSAYTSKAAKFNDFREVYQINACDWLWKGKPHYLYSKEPHGVWTFWVKDLLDI